MTDWDFTEKLYLAESEHAVMSLLKDQIAKIGFEEFGFASKYSIDYKGGDGSRTYVAHTHLSAIGNSYYAQLKHPEIAKRDARVQCSLLGFPPGAWNKEAKSSSALLVQKFIPSAIEQFKFAGELGLECGVTVPLHARRSEWCFFTFTRRDKTNVDDLERTVSDMSHAAQSVVSVMDRLLIAGGGLPKLTVREEEVLKWAAIGKTSWEISVILTISERTVNFHLTAAANKLGVKGRRAACTIAMAQGLIQFA